MFGHGKCPKCDQPVSRCDLDKIVVGDQFAGPFFHGVAICCPNPSCKTVLGVSIDPFTLVADIVAQVARRGQGLRR
jgi:energy-converting hydrogenase Eha subunit B